MVIHLKIKEHHFCTVPSYVSRIKNKIKKFCKSFTNKVY